MKILTRSSGIILGLAAITAFAATSQGQQPISVIYNGQAVQFDHAQPHRMGDVVCVPLRKVIESAGGTVEWNSYDKSVTVQKGDTHIEISTTDGTAKVNGVDTPTNGPVHIEDGTTMVPVRFLADTLGASIQWDDVYSQVNLSSNDAAALKTYPSTTDITPVPSTATTTDTTTSVTDLPPVISTQPMGSVLQVKLDDNLSSETSMKGDPFTATIDTNGNADYFGLPDGTKIKGHVSFVQPMHDGMPGVIGLSYDGLILNDGRRLSVWASPIGLDSDVMKDDSGRWTVTASGNTKDNLKFIGSGSSMGTLVPLLTTATTVTTEEIDAALPNRGEPNDVVLSQGTTLGVRIDKEAIIRAPSN